MPLDEQAFSRVAAGVAEKAPPGLSPQAFQKFVLDGVADYERQFPTPNTTTATTEQFTPPTDPVGEVLSGVGMGHGAGPSSAGFVGNLARGTLNMARNAPAAVRQIGLHPIKTAMGLPSAIADRAVKDVDVGEIYNDPAAFLGDAATILEGGAGAVRGVRAAARSAPAAGLRQGVTDAVMNTSVLSPGRMLKAGVRGYRKGAGAVRNAAEEAAAAAADGNYIHHAGPTRTIADAVDGAQYPRPLRSGGTPPPPAPVPEVPTGTAPGLDRFMPNQSAGVEDAARQEVQRLLGGEREAGGSTGAPPVENVPPTPPSAPASAPLEAPPAGAGAGAAAEDPFLAGATDLRADPVEWDSRISGVDTPPPPAAASAPTSSTEDAMHQALLEKLGGTAPAEAEPMVAQPAGTPRVLNWKPGAGPTVEDATRMRQEFGSRTGAQRLKTTQGQIKALTPTMDSALPDAARRAIDAKLATLTPEEVRSYLDAAPNPLARAYIESKLTP